MSFPGRYQNFLEKLQEALTRSGRPAESLRLIVVTKQQELEEVRQAYGLGCRDFGESRVQEALGKIPAFPNDVNWHLIGPLQSNKVKKIVGKFHLVHSVDRKEIAESISECSKEAGTATPVLLQVNTSREQSKHGFTPQGILEEISSLLELKGIEIRGLMTMAPFTQDRSLIRKCFRELFNLRERLQMEIGEKACMQELSMGMSHDWDIAVEEGATMLRVGTLLFGQRQAKERPSPP